ncbi:glycoside hydrolase family 13 protein [Blautia obeum]|uniref:glycoside hydrolase family 13 protein n=1 Tax=Blautia obeum TaxID=40520 RepID=UPI0018AADD81|nr:alpha-glucosidase [Blautia obeum]
MEKKWWKESVVYQIYPKSFKDSNGDGVGDIRGIIQKLDYLKELGVNVLWISPMLESPQDDNGYDISDYRRIYKEYGTMEDYEELLSEAHKRDIRILMDLVVNHTSDEHNWFVESRKSKDNPYRDYYIWKDPVNGKEPNNWGGAFGGSAWEYDPQTQMYYLHLFSKKQPDLNWENEKVRQEVYDMMTFWCEKGIDGFRMDVISMISKDQTFPDGEMNNSLYGDFGPYCVHGPRVHEFLQEMNREVLSRYDIMTVGETSGVTIEEAQKYAGEAGKELNMVFQFEHVDNGSGDYGKWTTEKYDFKEFKRIMIKWQEELQGKAWNSLFLGNHDQPRSVSRFGNDNPAYRETSAKMLATCLHMMQGTPYVYQGEELGMTNVYFDKLEDYRDIESINFFTELTEAGLMTPEYMMKCLMLRSRDNARTPMQWDDSAQAGFTDGESWIKVNPNYKEINAAQQLEDPNSIFHYYQKLIRLRKEKDIIVYGGFEPLYRDDEQIFAYIRRQEQEKLLTVCNFSDKNAEMEIPEEFKGAECLITNLDRTVFEGRIVLKPYEAFVLYKK